MKMNAAIKRVSFVFALTCFGLAYGLTAKNVYQKEYKHMKKQPHHRTTWERRSNIFTRNLMGRIENDQEVGAFGRMLRVKLLMQDPVVVTKKSMRSLYTFVKEVCEDQDIRIPTIYITKNKTGFWGASNCQSDSTKILMSAGALLIGQDLLLEVSQQALEAAIAHELCAIKHNHENKTIVISYVVPNLIARVLPAREGTSDQMRNSLASNIVVWALLSKRFEKQADRFVCEEMHNAEGLIELCRYWRDKEKRVDEDFDDVYDFMWKSNSSFGDFLGQGFGYCFSRTFHRIGKFANWISRKTFIGSKQSYDARIANALAYLNKRAA